MTCWPERHWLGFQLHGGRQVCGLYSCVYAKCVNLSRNVRLRTIYKRNPVTLSAIVFLRVEINFGVYQGHKVW